MGIVVHSVFTEGTDSSKTGRETGDSILAELGTHPKLVVVHLTDNHDQRQFLSGIREAIGSEVPVLGCSGQGVMARGKVVEEGYAAGAMGFGGDTISIGSGCVEEIQEDTLEKGKSLGTALKATMNGKPKAVVLYYDPLCGVEIDPFLEGLSSEVGSSIIGGGAAHSYYYAPLRKTFQYFGDRVMEHAAVAFALAGDCTVELGVCHGCAPIGLEMEVTKSEGNRLLELDGHPAATVWEDLAGSSDQDSNNIAALGIGIPINPDDTSAGYLMRTAYSMDLENGVVLASNIAEGTRVMLHHRTVDDVMNGAETMAKDIRQRVDGKTVRAVLGFECGARAKPFLGTAGTLEENTRLQKIVAPDAEWLGFLAWGELVPMGGKPTFHNYAFPILVIAE
jgi:hypothetical protein